MQSLTTRTERKKASVLINHETNFSAADLHTHNKKMQMQRQKALASKMTRNHEITFTPRDFNYDNHHYQYLKYTKRAKVSRIFCLDELILIIIMGISFEFELV